MIATRRRHVNRRGAEAGIVDSCSGRCGAIVEKEWQEALANHAYSRKQPAASFSIITQAHASLSNHFPDFCLGCCWVQFIAERTNE